MGLLSRAADKSSVEPLSEENQAFEETAETSEASPEIKTLEEKITQYHETHATFHCLVLEHSGSAGEAEKDDFPRKVSEMISKAGLVIPLSQNRPLILLPATADRELIVHRISKSLKIIPLLSFEASNPENALKTIESLQ